MTDNDEHVVGTERTTAARILPADYLDQIWNIAKGFLFNPREHGPPSPQTVALLDVRLRAVHSRYLNLAHARDRPSPAKMIREISACLGCVQLCVKEPTSRRFELAKAKIAEALEELYPDLDDWSRHYLNLEPSEPGDRSCYRKTVEMWFTTLTVMRQAMEKAQALPIKREATAAAKEYLCGVALPDLYFERTGIRFKLKKAADGDRYIKGDKGSAFVIDCHHALGLGPLDPEALASLRKRARKR